MTYILYYYFPREVYGVVLDTIFFHFTSPQLLKRNHQVIWSSTGLVNNNLPSN